MPIRIILSRRINHIRDTGGGNDSVSNIIRSCLGVLEESVRFKLVKYFSAYIDILRLVALERGFDEGSLNIEPYHIYLEFGSCNRHSLNLMALGLSRFTALYLEDKFIFQDIVEAEEYLKKIMNMDLDKIKIPTVCLRELKDLVH